METYKILLLLCFGIFWPSIVLVSSDKRLADYDLEELEDKLAEFDVDDDGQLTELEVQLHQPGIQKYLDRFEELMKEAQAEDDDDDEGEPIRNKRAETDNAEEKEEAESVMENKIGTPKPGEEKTVKESTQTNTERSQENTKNVDAHTDKPIESVDIIETGKKRQEEEEDDDGVEIEVVDEMEYVTGDEDKTDAGLSKHVLTGILAGVLSVVIATLVMLTRSGRAVKYQQREELLLQKREEWLKKIFSKNASLQAEKPLMQAAVSDSCKISASVTFSDDLDTSSNCLLGDADRVLSSLESNASSVSTGNNETVSDFFATVKQTLCNENSVIRDADGNCSSQGGGSTTQINSSHHSDEILITEDSKLNSVGKKNTPLFKKPDLNKSVGNNTKVSPAPSSMSQELPDQSRKCKTVSAVKTSDLEKLKLFLEKVFNCTITLLDDLQRMRFIGGKMRIPKSAFPSTLEDLEVKMRSLSRSAFDKQVNKVKISINAFNICDSDAHSYNDRMVQIAAVIIKKESIATVLSHFKEETSSSLHEAEDSLWGSKGGSELYESYGFLPRLVGCASDKVNVSPALLSELLASEMAGDLVSSLLAVGGQRLASVPRLDELLLSEGTVLQALDVLVRNNSFGNAFGYVLAKEKEKAYLESLGNYFEKHSAMSGLLSISTIPPSSKGQQDFVSPPAAVAPFRMARSFPQLSAGDIETAQTMIQKGISKLKEIVYTAMRQVITCKTTREAGLSWVAAVINLNELRTSSVLQDNNDIQPVCSDGFMLNLCSVLLEFFLPISQSWDKLQKVDTGYSASPSCRLSYDFESCLAGGQIVCDRQEHKEGSRSSGEASQHSFITECYHLTQRALSVTVVPAIKHFNKMISHFSRLLEQVKGTSQEETLKAQHLLIAVTWETCLMESELVHNITLFYISQAKILLNIINQAEQTCKSAEEVERVQQKALSVIPEFCIKDMAQWFAFLAYNVLQIHPNATKGISLTPFVDCCVMLLERPDLMPGPVPASMIVSALLAFMKDPESKNHRFGTSWGSGIISDLAAMVHTCPTVQTKLGPALLRTYVSVDVVEGLDVDKDSFDKFSARIQIGELVGKLWSRIDCRASIINQCGSELFQNFLDSILDTLLYMLHDSLSRLANVKKIETLKENEHEWNALSKREQAEKDLFLRNEESVGSGFMRQAKKTLNFLTLLSQSEKVAAIFTRQPLATRAASTFNGFLDALCGAKAKSLKVKDMSKYQFNPVELLSDIVGILMRIAVEDTSPTDGFLISMVKDPDFELANMEKAESVICSKSCPSEDTEKKVKSLLQSIRHFAKELSIQVQSESEEENNWREAFIDLQVSKDDLEQSYKSAMENRRFGEAHISESHCFLSNMTLTQDPRSPKVKTLLKEIKQLATSLPVQAAAAIFVRQDKKRVDVMRAMITGPTGTPYSLGCFCFDVYFPTSYPNVPPLVKIVTTGNGTVRFNPNLYADGKVCLSLLGTWHAGDASEKWTPGKSSLYQVLVSIQSMILTPDPVFNEPGYERLRGTHEGEVQSRQYNWKLHLHTLRHAVLGQLKNPPPGFELLIRHHFALQKEAILKQCAEWVQNCEDPDLIKRMRRAADAIFNELMSLEVDLQEQEEDSEEDDEESDD